MLARAREAADRSHAHARDRASQTTSQAQAEAAALIAGANRRAAAVAVQADRERERVAEERQRIIELQGTTEQALDAAVQKLHEAILGLAVPRRAMLAEGSADVFDDLQSKPSAVSTAPDAVTAEDEARASEVPSLAMVDSGSDLDLIAPVAVELHPVSDFARLAELVEAIEQPLPTGKVTVQHLTVGSAQLSVVGARPVVCETLRSLHGVHSVDPGEPGDTVAVALDNNAPGHAAQRPRGV